MLTCRGPSDRIDVLRPHLDGVHHLLRDPRVSEPIAFLTWLSTISKTLLADAVCEMVESERRLFV
jgi:hypothetical protein